MLRRHALFCLSLALAATTMAPDATSWDKSALRRASAATMWDAPATRVYGAATQIPPGASHAQAGTVSSTVEDYTTHSLIVQEEIILNLLNQDRISAGLAPLTHDPALSAIARMKSQDMVDGGYFAHESPTWGKARDMLTRLGYSFRACGENIARHATVEKAQAAFMTSEGHRRNILSPNLERVGVGVVFDRNGHPYVTQLFAR